MVLVTAANGNVGRRLIPQLVKKGLEVKAMDINPAVESLGELGVRETFVGDARKPEDVKRALEGCDRVLYVPPLLVYDEAKIAKQFIDIATDFGVAQYVFVSVTHPQMSTLLQHTQKLQGEEHLIYKGLTHSLNYTILRPMHYNHNFTVQSVWDNNFFPIFYNKDAKLSYVDAGDVGEVAAKVLTEDGHQNAAYDLVGPDFLSAFDLVDTFNRITGRSAVVQQLDTEEAISLFGITDSYSCEGFRGIAYTYGNFGIAGNPNVLTWLLGRAPTTFAEFVKNELNRLNLMEA